MKQYHITGFSSAITDAKEIAEQLSIQPVFKDARSHRRNAQFDERPDDTITDPKEIYRVQYFNVIVDQAISSFNERFKQLKLTTISSAFFGSLPKCRGPS